MKIKQQIQNILDRNFTRGDNTKALNELLVLYNVMPRINYFKDKDNNIYAINDKSIEVEIYNDGSIHFFSNIRDLDIPKIEIFPIIYEA